MTSTIRPFDKALPPELCFAAQRHREAAARLDLMVEHARRPHRRGWQRQVYFDPATVRLAGRHALSADTSVMRS